MIDGHLELKDIDKSNYPYYMETPDKNFSRARNLACIQYVIEEGKRRRNTIDPIVAKNAGNVADIIASFAKYKLDRDGGKKLEQWLGRGWMTRVYGEKLVEKIKMMKEIQEANLKKGNTLFGGNFYIS